MKSIIIIYFCVLLLSIVSNGVGEDPLVEKLNSMAEKNENISGVFIPSEQGFLGGNCYEIIYKGTLLPSGMKVAMKFKAPVHGKHEYEMYTHLSAIANPDVEAYGIPAIYYYGRWNEYAIMAMTLIDNKFYGKKFTQIDLLIFFREFVRITKYIHISGVFHVDVQLKDIWFRKHQGFIYDFNSAKKLIIPDETPQDRLVVARRDWKEFFNSMCSFVLFRIPTWKWLGFSYNDNHDKMRMRTTTNFVLGLENDAERRQSHNFTGLRKVYVEFAKWAYCNDSTPPTTSFYDQMYQVIVDELKNYAQKLKKPPTPSWLSGKKDKRVATEAIEKIPTISVIRDPFELEEIEYEEVNYEFFRKNYHKLYRDQPSTSEEPEPGKKSHKFLNCFKA